MNLLNHRQFVSETDSRVYLPKKKKEGMFLPAKISVSTEPPQRFAPQPALAVTSKGDVTAAAMMMGSKPPLVGAPGSCCFDVDTNDCSLQAVSWNEKEMSLHVGKVAGHSDPSQL